MSTILSLVFSKAGLYAAAAIALLAVGWWLHYHWVHGDAPKQYTQVLAVAAAENGATLSVKSGFRGRSTQPVFVAGIAAPGLNDPLGPQSRDNLAVLAGDTVRVVMDRPGLFGRGQPLVGQVFGATGADLALAQLRAGFAKCESQATKDQIAAQKEAQSAKRGLWASVGGSHWWHFGIAAADFPDPIPLVPETDAPMLDYGLILEIAALAILAFWIFWYFAGAAIVAKFAGASTVTAAVDTSEQLAAYAALTLIRYSPAVQASPTAVTDCENLRTIVTAWELPATAAATGTTTTAKAT